MDTSMASVYTDFGGLAQLKTQARLDQDAALDEVAQQFEALMLQMMLKSMRQASPGDDLFDSQAMRFHRDMYDQQLALHLSESGGLGLSEVLKSQLSGETGGQLHNRGLDDYRREDIMRSLRLASADDTRASGQVSADAAPVEEDQQSFLERLLPYAETAATALGLAPEALLAQAALETGWGRHVMRHANGESSHNLFGIKADGRWEGDRVQVSTLEYRDGVAVREKASFRAYASEAEALNDYVSFVRDNPRYREALENAGDAENYFRELQKAGYATDPAYADKISRILRGEEMQSLRQDVDPAVVAPSI